MPDGMAVPIDPDFDRRWAEWQMRGRVHERLVRGRLLVALPGIACLAAIAALLLS